MVLETLSVNAGKVRRERMGGKEYLVAPFTSLGPRVLNGSKGALYYPRNEIEANPGVWNNVPLTLGHPTDPITNMPVSAKEPGVVERVGLGHIAKDRIENGWRKGEAWFDAELTKNRAPDVYLALMQNKPIELSTGLYTDNEPVAGVTNEGQPYDYIARNYTPDHLAVLPNQTGACSVNDGCGINVNAWSDAARQAAQAARSASAKASNATDETNVGGKTRESANKAFTASRESDGAKNPAQQHRNAASEHFAAGSRHEQQGHADAAKAHFTAAKAHIAAADKIDALKGHKVTGNAWSDEARAASAAARKASSAAKAATKQTGANGREMATSPGSSDLQPTHENRAFHASKEAGRHSSDADPKHFDDDSHGQGGLKYSHEHAASAHEQAASHHQAAADSIKWAEAPAKANHQAAADAHTKAAEAHRSAASKLGKQTRNETTPLTFWQRLGMAFGMTFNEIPMDLGGAQQPRHLETGEFLPKGTNRGEKQFQTAAERGFSHLTGGSAPSNDVDDDGDEDVEEFGESGGRVEPGMEMDHHPMPTDRGPSRNKKVEKGEEDETVENDITGTGMAGSPLHVSLNQSHEELRGHVQKALDANTTRDQPPASIHQVHDDHVIYHDGESHKKQTFEKTDDGVKLTGKPVPVKPVTKFEPVQNQESSMTANERQQAVRWLTVNCDCYKNKEKLLANKELYTDDDIVALVKNTVQAKKHATMVANAQKAGIQLNEKAAFSSADQTAESQVDSNDSKNKTGEEETLPMFKKNDVKGKPSLNAFLDGAPPEVRTVIEQALAANANRKNQLIAMLTRNYRDPQQKLAAATAYGKMEQSDLEVLAQSVTNTARPAPKPVFGPEIDAEVLNGTRPEPTENQNGPDVLPMPSLAWPTALGARVQAAIGGGRA